MYEAHIESLAIDDAGKTVSEDSSQSNQRITTKITRYLRWVGSLLIILSAISFMLQGHQDIVPAYRYWIGLGFTLLMCLGGLICAYFLHETKGARIFFGLGAAFLPVQVSQVSAMVYAYWHGQSALQPQYAWLQFMDVNPTLIAVDFVITGVLLLLVSYACYAILARKHLKTLLWATIAGNLMLLLPVRDGALIAVIIAALFILLRQTEQHLYLDSAMRLYEGLAARALITLPLWIIIGRSLLHPTSFLLALVISLIVAVYCIVDIKRYTQSAWIIYCCQWLGTFAALGSWVIVQNQLSSFTDTPLTGFLPAVVILFLLSSYVDYHARLYRSLSAILTILLSYGAMMDQQTMAPIFTFAAGILLTIAGIKYREKVTLFSGNICVAGGFLFYWDYALDIYSAAPWISSIILGLLVILLASYIENKDKQIVAKSLYYFNELKHWN